MILQRRMKLILWRRMKLKEDDRRVGEATLKSCIPLCGIQEDGLFFRPVFSCYFGPAVLFLT